MDKSRFEHLVEKRMNKTKKLDFDTLLEMMEQLGGLVPLSENTTITQDDDIQFLGLTCSDAGGLDETKLLEIFPKIRITEEIGVLDTDERKVFMQYMDKIQGNNLQEKLEFITDFIDEEPPADADFREALSRIIFLECLNTIVKKFSPSGSGFNFEAFLAALLSGKQVTEKVQGKLPIDDIRVFTNPDGEGGRAMSLKLLSPDTDVKGSILSLLAYFVESGITAGSGDAAKEIYNEGIEYLISIKYGDDVLSFYSITLTPRNIPHWIQSQAHFTWSADKQNQLDAWLKTYDDTKEPAEFDLSFLRKAEPEQELNESLLIEATTSDVQEEKHRKFLNYFRPFYGMPKTSTLDKTVETYSKSQSALPKSAVTDSNASSTKAASYLSDPKFVENAGQYSIFNGYVGRMIDAENKLDNFMHLLNNDKGAKIAQTTGAISDKTAGLDMGVDKSKVAIDPVLMRKQQRAYNDFNSLFQRYSREYAVLKSFVGKKRSVVVASNKYNRLPKIVKNFVDDVVKNDDDKLGQRQLNNVAQKMLLHLQGELQGEIKQVNDDFASLRDRRFELVKTMVDSFSPANPMGRYQTEMDKKTTRAGSGDYKTHTAVENSLTTFDKQVNVDNINDILYNGFTIDRSKLTGQVSEQPDRVTITDPRVTVQVWAKIFALGSAGVTTQFHISPKAFKRMTLDDKYKAVAPTQPGGTDGVEGLKRYGHIQLNEKIINDRIVAYKDVLNKGSLIPIFTYFANLTNCMRTYFFSPTKNLTSGKSAIEAANKLAQTMQKSGMEQEIKTDLDD